MAKASQLLTLNILL